MTITNISGPLIDLEQKIVDTFADIEMWLREEFSQTPPVFYSSVDLRNNGQKIASIDTNVFPGGFNNIAVANYPLAAEAIKRQVESLCPGSKSVVLVPENHTRNAAYLNNISTLRYLFEAAGLAAQLGRLDKESIELTAGNGDKLSMLPIKHENGRIRCGDLLPCAVILNNDLSSGLPSALQNLDIPTMPTAAMGWYARRKSTHFYQYQRAAEQLAQLLNADPWLLNADFSVCDNVDFQQRSGLECLATAVGETLSQINEKYRQHGVKDQPFVVLKSDKGTYGMGVMIVRDAEEIFSLNRKQRNKMSVGKDRATINSILIQEGINTMDEFSQAPAEPVIYMIGETVVGGFYRINEHRARHENLNSSGMSFSALPFATACNPPLPTEGDEVSRRLYVYGVIARLATLAAAREAAKLNAAQ